MSAVGRRASRKGFVPASGELAGKRFASKQAYRNALAQAKGYENDYQLRQARKRFNAVESLEALDADARAARERALEALGLMRSEGLSLRGAAERVGTTPRTVHKYVGPALRKEGRKYRAAERDDLLRPLALLTPEGNRRVWVRSSRDARLIAQYQNAVRLYIRTGDDSGLARFERAGIRDASGAWWPFVTDRELVKRLGSAGVLSFESIYRQAA